MRLRPYRSSLAVRSSARLALTRAAARALLIGLAGCAAPTAGTSHTALPQLSYAFEIQRTPEPELFITLHARGSAARQTEFSVADFSGGVETGGDDIHGLRAFDAAGVELPVERPASHRWIVTHEPGAALRLAYSIRANEYQASQDTRTARRPILNERLFHSGGALFLVIPNHLDEGQVVDIELAWEGLAAAGWQAASSFSAAPEPLRMQRCLAELHQSIFVAGEIELFHFDVHGHPLVVAAQGGWGFDITTFAQLAREVVAAEREFFDDFDHPHYLISLIPFGEIIPGSSSYEGTGLTQSFSLMVQRGTTIEPRSPNREGILFLLAHEMFHAWNGVTFSVAQPEELGYWFSEGFTEFYARRLLYRRGWISAERYVESLNESLVAYFASPVRDTPNDRIREDFWSDARVQKLPYRRGDLIALTLDLAIAKESGGEHSLDDLMRALLRRAYDGDNILTNDDLLALFGEWGGENVADRIWQLIEGTRVPSFDEDELPRGLAVTMHALGAFDLGFDDQISCAAGLVSGVRANSRAHAAGLRNGQHLTGWSIHYGNVEREVELQILEADEVQTIRYLPIGELIDTPQFRLLNGTDSAAF